MWSFVAKTEMTKNGLLAWKQQSTVSPIPCKVTWFISIIIWYFAKNTTQPLSCMRFYIISAAQSNKGA